MRATTGFLMIALTAASVVQAQAQKAAPAGKWTEAQARHILTGSCSNLSTLHQDVNGNWHGICSKGAMMAGPDGKAVKYTGDDAGITGPHARSLAMEQCSNMSHMKMSSDGTWTGRCSKGVVMVNQAGEVSFKK